MSPRAPSNPTRWSCASTRRSSLQPRPRVAPTTPAAPGRPTRCEHEYRRVGALKLLAAFNTRTGEVLGRCDDRKRQVEFIDFLEALEAATPSAITMIHGVLDNVRTHKGKQVMAWLAMHPRFVFHFTPVHGSWMNQVEQCFGGCSGSASASPTSRPRLDLSAAIGRFITESNDHAHPFRWDQRSAEKLCRWARRRPARKVA
ncbi:MAG: IS630 family transposase [Planctomycetota bacterium]